MILLISIIILALVFDFINGFHDAANSITTIVTTKVLTPFQAVLWAAFFNFVAFFISKYIIGENSKGTFSKYSNSSVVYAKNNSLVNWQIIYDKNKYLRLHNPLCLFFW